MEEFKTCGRVGFLLAQYFTNSLFLQRLFLAPLFERPGYIPQSKNTETLYSRKIHIG